MTEMWRTGGMVLMMFEISLDLIEKEYKIIEREGIYHTALRISTTI